MTPDRHRLVNYRAIPPKPISAANQESFSAIGVGDMFIHAPNGSTSTKIQLRYVLYAPNMGCTLISISQIDQAGYSVAFQDGKCIVCNLKNRVVAQIQRTKDLYHVKRDPTYALTAETLTLDELHRCHGHVTHSTLKRMVSEGLINGIKLKDAPTTPCKPCLLAKAKRKPIPSSRSGTQATKLGELIYSNVWGPATTRTIGHAEYYVVFVDDAKRWIAVDLMRRKSDTFDNYKGYEAWLKTQFDVNIKCFQSDKGGEYTSNEFLQHTKSKGTIHQFSVHNVHGQNGVPERAHYTLLDGITVGGSLEAHGMDSEPVADQGTRWNDALRGSVWGEANLEGSAGMGKCMLGNEEVFKDLRASRGRALDRI